MTMTKIGYFNKGEKLILMQTSKKDAEKIIGGHIFQLVEKIEDIDAETLNGKRFIIIDGKIEWKDFTLPEIPEGKTAAHSFVKMLEAGETGYMFDAYAVYSIKDGIFTELKREDFDIRTCKYCGKIFMKKDMANESCIPCYVEHEVADLLTIQPGERYTEFESDSEASEVIDRIKRIVGGFRNSTTIMNASRDKISAYLDEKKVSGKVKKLLMNF